MAHCGHGEDETAAGVCSGSGLSALLGLDVTKVLAYASLGLLLAGAGAAALCIWSLRRTEVRGAAQSLNGHESFTSELLGVERRRERAQMSEYFIFSEFEE